MYNLYKKNNNLENELEMDENPFFMPTLLCIPSSNEPQNIFGTLNLGLELARVENNHTSYNYKINEVPINFLTLEMKEPDYSIDLFVKKYIKPLIYDEDGNILDVNSVCKRFRNINILSYCAGTDIYKAIEYKIRKMLLNTAYYPKDADKILSNISLIAIATEVDTNKLKATAFRYLDVLDDENIFTPRYFEREEDIISRNNLNYFIANNSSNYDIFYSHLGTHSLKIILSDKCICKYLSTINMIYILNNSILNYETNTYIPLDSKDLISCIINGVKMRGKISLEEIKKDIDEHHTYYGCLKELSNTRKYIK